VPTALVSLVDADRQWTKPHQGLDASETWREMPFCVHAILGSEALVVPDALQDSRFAENPLVTGEPRVRFYARHPLSTPDGSHVGTLCIIDGRPREIDQSELRALRYLAALVEEQRGAGIGR
jgi:GAF domain-containing protein